MKFSYILLPLLALLLISCNESTNSFSVNTDLKSLIDVGYSIKELSIRTEYSEEELIEAYQNDAGNLLDSAKNEKIHLLYELNRKDEIIPINQTNISAYDGIWQIYTKAQNLPRTSLFTGIGVTKVANALMKRKPLNDEDSIRALVSYVNLLYGLEDMPPSINKYFTKTSSLKDVIVPDYFPRNYPDDVKLKIEYYIWQNEQFELRANENLKKSIENRLDSHIKKSVEDFISDDVKSVFNTGLVLFKDSIETYEFYREKLNERLDLSNIDKSIQDEIITYCISVNCSRAILIGEVLDYQEFSNSLSIKDKKIMSDYIANLEDLTIVLQKNKKVLGTDAAILAISIPISLYTYGAINSGTINSAIILSNQTAKALLLDFFAFEGIDVTFKNLFNYEVSDGEVEKAITNMQNRLKNDLNEHLSNSLNTEGNYFDALNNNTIEYYNNVRTFFNIKNKNE